MNGFINNIHALRWLWNHLKDDYGFEYLCTNYLTQDPQENNFSEIRRRCGRNDVPTAYQFGAAYKYAALAASAKLTEGTNCEHDDALPFLEEKDFSEESHSEVPHFTYKFQPLDTKRPSDYTPKELNALMYIIGASVLKLKHKKCRKRLLLSQSEVIQESNMAYTFSLLKNARCYPGTILFEIGFLAYTAFRQRFSKYLYQSRKNVKARLSEHVDYDKFEGNVCLTCFRTVLDKIFNTLISGYLKELRAQKRTASKKVVGNGHRNKKARRMNLPEL